MRVAWILVILLIVGIVGFVGIASVSTYSKALGIAPLFGSNEPGQVDLELGQIEESAICGSGTELVDNECVIVQEGQVEPIKVPESEPGQIEPETELGQVEPAVNETEPVKVPEPQNETEPVKVPPVKLPEPIDQDELNQELLDKEQAEREAEEAKIKQERIDREAEQAKLDKEANQIYCKQLKDDLIPNINNTSKIKEIHDQLIEHCKN